MIQRMIRATINGIAVSVPAGTTIFEAARGVQTTRQYLACLMTGQRDEPRLSLVEALADVFGVPAAYFTADYLGRVASDLLPLLSAMHDPSTRALITRPDLAAALAAPAVAGFLDRHPLAACSPHSPTPPPKPRSRTRSQPGPDSSRTRSRRARASTRRAAILERDDRLGEGVE